MGIIDRLVGAHITEKLNTWAKDNAVPRDYPKKDLKKLQEIATETADKLPALATDLMSVLPKTLPDAASVTTEMQSAAQRVTDHLLQLVPAKLEDEVEDARDGADDVTWAQVKTKYGELRKAMKSAPYWKDALPDAMVAFAAKHDVTPDELSGFSQNIEQVRAMIPVLAAVGDDVVQRLEKLDEILVAALGPADDADDAEAAPPPADPVGPDDTGDASSGDPEPDPADGGAS
jgi:hypothetical protein